MRAVWKSALLALLVPGAALAHGGIPFGVQPFTEGGELVAAGGTTGFVFVDGPEPVWVCEDGFFLQPTDWLLAPGDRILAATAFGLRLSDDRGCSWSVPKHLNQELVSDLAGDPLDPEHLYAAVATSGGLNGVAHSLDAGASWRMVLDQPGSRFVSVRPEDAGPRLWAVARNEPGGAAAIWSSPDRGETWVGPQVLTGWTDAVLLDVSPDGARLVLTARSPESRFHLVGVPGDGGGDAVDLGEFYAPPTSAAEVGGTLFVGIGAERLMRQTDDGWVEIPGPPPSCLQRHGEALWACSYPPLHAQYLRSLDGGETWEDVLRFEDVRLAECPADSVTAEICPEVFEMIQAQLIQVPGDDDDDVTADDDDTSIFFADDDDDDEPPGCDCAGGAALLLLPWWPAVRHRPHPSSRPLHSP